MDQADALSSTPPEIHIKGHERRDLEHTLHFTQKQNQEHSSKFIFESNMNPYALEHKLQHISLFPKIKKTKRKSGHWRILVVLLWSYPTSPSSSPSWLMGCHIQPPPPRVPSSTAPWRGEEREGRAREEDLTGPPCRRRVNLPLTRSSGQEEREAPATTQGRGRGVGHGWERSEGKDRREGATRKRGACKRIRTRDEKCEGIRARNFFLFLYSMPSHRLGSVIKCCLL